MPVDLDKIVSARPLGWRTRLKARFALWLSRKAPGLYERWTLSGVRKWQQSRPVWTALDKPLAECTVALISSGGILLRGQEPFDLENPRGDCSYRVIPANSSLDDIVVSHAFYDSSDVRKDPEVMLPLGALKRLAEQGRIGRVAPQHFTLSGSIPDPTELLYDTAPELARLLTSDEVDLALLTPA